MNILSLALLLVALSPLLSSVIILEKCFFGNAQVPNVSRVSRKPLYAEPFPLQFTCLGVGQVSSNLTNVTQCRPIDTGNETTKSREPATSQTVSLSLSPSCCFYKVPLLSSRLLLPFLSSSSLISLMIKFHL